VLGASPLRLPLSLTAVVIPRARLGAATERNLLALFRYWPQVPATFPRIVWPPFAVHPIRLTSSGMGCRAHAHTSPFALGCRPRQLGFEARFPKETLWRRL
jgi:hypothetical protein